MTWVWAQPAWLGALVLVVGWAVLDRWGGRTVAGVLARAAVGTALVVALAEPTVRWPVEGRVEVVVVDVSDSIPVAERHRAFEAATARRADGVAVGLVLFAGTPQVAVVPGGPWPEALPTPEVDPTRSDLGGALRTAANLVPGDRAGLLRVFGDGRWDPAPDLVAQLTAAGISIEAEALSPDRSDPALAALEPGRAAVAPGETLQARLVVHGGSTGLSGPVVLAVEGVEIGRADVEVGAGASADLTLTGSVPVDARPGLVELSAAVGSHRTARGVRVVPPPTVWVIGDRAEATRPLARWLRADGVDAEVVRVGDLPAEVPAIDVVVLVDVPANAGYGAAPLPRSWADGLDAHVWAGGGLVVVGGERSFDQGGWAESSLADLLPVGLDPKGRERDDSATLVLALDKSGSMAAPAGVGGAAGMGARLVGGGGTGTRFYHVQLAAMAAVRALRDTDQVGVLAVDTEARWAVPVTSADPRLPVVRSIGKLTAAGGGVHVKAALEEGLGALRRAETPLRHMVLFADAADVDGRVGGLGSHPLDVVRLLARDDVTVSVIAVGPGTGADSQVLEQLALEGGGRFARAERYEDLTALFVAETERMLGQGIEDEDVVVVAGRYHPAQRGVGWGSAPALLGRNRVEERAGTRVWATAEGGEPLLASWRVGLGEVVAVATDLGGGWGRPWAHWSGAPRLWTQTVRHLARPAAADEDVALTLEGDRVRVGLRPDLGPMVPELAWTTDDGAGTAALRLVAPGVWEAPDPVPPGVRGTVSVVGSEGPGTASHDVWRAPTEDRWRTADDAALAALRVVATAPPLPSRALALGPWSLALALLLLPLDAAVRRRRRAP